MSNTASSSVAVGTASANAAAAPDDSGEPPSVQAPTALPLMFLQLLLPTARQIVAADAFEPHDHARAAASPHIFLFTIPPVQ